MNEFEPCPAGFKYRNQNSFRTIGEHEQEGGDAFTYVLLDCDRSRNNVLRVFLL